MPQAKDILDAARQAHVKPHKTYCDKWLKTANGLGDVGLIRLILQVRPRGGAKISSKPIKSACNSGNYELAKLFIDHMNLNNGTTKNAPLYVAIRTCDLDLIAAVLDAGANIDLQAYKGGQSSKPKGSREYRTPVEVAMRYGTQADS